MEEHHTPWLCQRVPIGLWKDEGVRQSYMAWLGRRLNFTSFEDWYKLSTNIFKSNYGDGLLRKYNSKVIDLLKDLFPDHIWFVWKFKSSPKDIWKDDIIRKQYMDWLGKHLGYKTIEDWYGITQQTIVKNYGSRLLSGYFQGSPMNLLKHVYPEYDWMPWLFNEAPTGTWDKPGMVRMCLDWLGIKLRFTTMEDWYKIRANDFKYHVGNGILHKFSHSPSDIVKFAYPEHEWVPWKFLKCQVHTWNDINTRHEYVVWLGKQLKYENMDDWYNITSECFQKHYGWSFIAIYNGSCFAFLNDNFPEKEWLPWKMKCAPLNTWTNPVVQKQYMEWLKLQLGYKKDEDWYNLTQDTMHANHGAGLLPYFQGSPFKILRHVYPEIDWDANRFGRMFSNVSIEWLEYISNKDNIFIQHGMNLGEFRIPGSRLKADGYCAETNTVYEFYGTYWHGCPIKYSHADTINPSTKCTFSELHQRTIKREAKLKELGFNVISIWESEWRRIKKDVLPLKNA